jgi:hypothetical protein
VKKFLMLAMVLGLLVGGVTFAGQFKPMPMKFEDGTACTIPSDWKLITVERANLWFQDKEGNVYLVKIEMSKEGQPTVWEIVYKINSKK